MIRIVAPHFVAGVEVVDGVVTTGAPILRYMRGWTVARVESYAKSKGWTTEWI
jgi:hypothetical protein